MKQTDDRVQSNRRASASPATEGARYLLNLGATHA